MVMAVFYHRTVRCFLALDLPRPVRNHLAKQAQRFGTKGNVKWVPADQIHLTLVFAGELAETDARAFCDALRDFDPPPLSLSLDGLGHFPPRGEPRVVWAGLSGDVDALIGLQGELAALAERHGVPRENRAFAPHVTLGRVRSAFGALALVDQLEEVGGTLNGKPWSPTDLAFYRSELRPGGPVHTSLLRRPVPPA
jgi:2'-5' RNA ligase